MATASQKAAIELYALLMEQLKTRMAAIHHAIKNKHPWPDPITQDFCYLQLRLVCELIAIGCLVAHGDVVASTKLHKEYQADKILRALETLHPNFFPTALTQRVIEPGQFRLDPVPSGFMTKGEFISLYRKCGDALHIGSLRKVSTQDRTDDLAAIDDSCVKLATLLNTHRLALADGRMSILCSMKTEPKGRVQVVIAEPFAPDAAYATDVTSLP